MSAAIDEARATLLRALDELDEAEATLNGIERVDLVVIYAAGRRDGEAWAQIGGWASTAGPKWVHVALLRRAADAHDEAMISVDDEDE
jgi:hypothetical protein